MTAQPADHPEDQAPAAGGMRLTEQEGYELLTHLVTSADICRFEPHYYGSFRLIDAASQLIGHMLRHGDGGPTDQWLRRYKEELDTKKVWMMWDRPGYFEFLGEAAGPLARQLAARAGRGTAPGAGAGAGASPPAPGPGLDQNPDQNPDQDGNQDRGQDHDQEGGR